MANKKRIAPALFLLLSLLVVCAALYFGQAGKPTPSHAPGFYPEPFYLELRSLGREIYYTLDGSEPDRNSPRYTGPLYIQDATPNANTMSVRTDLETHSANTVLPTEPVDKCTILKAVAYDCFGNRGQTLCASYFVGYENRTGYGGLKVISVVTEPDNLTDYDIGIFVTGKTFDEQKDTWTENTPGNYNQKGREWEREAYLQYFDPSGDLLYESPCGIRVMGGWHRKSVLKSLNLYAREEYGGSERFHYDFWGTGFQPHKMTIHSGSNDYYSKVHNPMVSELTRELNYGTMHYEPCHVFLNGEYWGIYHLTEKYDTTYLAETYQVDPGTVLSVKAGRLENGSEEDFHLFEETQQFVINADMTLEENYRRFQQLIDEQSLLDLYAVEIYCGRNFDWPSGNYHVWRTVSTGESGCGDGKWRYLLYDMDGFGLTPTQLDLDTIHTTMRDSPFFSSLMKNEVFRKKLGANILRVGTEYLSPDRIRSFMEEYRNQMADPMKVYYRRFYSSDETMFYTHTDGNLLFFDNRMEYMMKILEAYDMLPT